MFFLYSFLFFFISFISFFLGVYLIDYNSFFIEFLFPFYILDEVSFTLCFDYISFFFFFSVSLISSVVFLYSKFYMDDYFKDLNYINFRFFFLLFLFVISMMFLVFSGSWLGVMLGWDGLGVVSFLLVIFYNNSASLDSGLITFFTNRLGDCLFILSFMFMFYSGWVSVDFLVIDNCLLFSLVIFLGCVTKSAQIPFSSWLPAAMAAPTPVSSLVHSSTLVTAGVYLLIRFNFLLDSIFFLLLPISLMTMLLAGVCAVYELDFKKVVAMSTLSQLGFMIFSVSLGYWLLGFFHMMFHAFFKSSLFLSTGNLMHYSLGGQDSRDFSSFGSSFFSKLFFSMSCLSLSGFPFSLGFYSKDILLTMFFSGSFSLLSLGFIFSCCFTVAYSFRLIYMGFMGFPSFSSSLSFLDSLFFYCPVVILYFICVFFGNFFFFYFFPFLCVSFLDFSLGAFLIVLGYFLFRFIPVFFLFVTSFMSIFFLSFISSSISSSFLGFMPFRGEYTWGEIVGAKGVNTFLLMGKFHALRLYSLYFPPLLLVVGLIILVVVF